MRNQIKILNYICSTDRFKLIFFLIIILSLYGSIVLGISNSNFIDSIFIPFSFPIFNIFMFALLFFNTLNTCSIFDKKFSFYIIRLKTKNNYIKEILKTTVFLNLFYFLIFFIFYFISLNIFKLGNFTIHPYSDYVVNNLIYVVFYLIRYVAISLLITMISALCYVNLKGKITMAINVIFLMGFMLTPTISEVRSGFTIVPWNYFSNDLYSSFITEISFSILFIFVLELIIYIIYHLTLKNKKLVIT